MQYDCDTIGSGHEGSPVYRRHYRKRDGRDLFLYGATPHQLAPTEELDDTIVPGGEMRWHPLRQEWNVYAAHRQGRTYKPAAALDPLAPARPGAPPTEIPFSDFEVAVFENKFTSFHLEAPAPSAPAIFDAAPARGRCDVVVYTSENEGNLFAVGQERRRVLLAAWIDRYDALRAEGCKFVLPFESRGEEVGVTLHHPHGQIYGFPHTPHPQQRAYDAFAQGYSLEADIAAWPDTYLVSEAEDLVAFCPPFARFPFEVWIAPRKAMPGPWAFTETQKDAFAFLLGDITRRYDAFFQRPAATMMGLHAAGADAPDNYHFTTQFYPILRAPDRVKFLASVEQHTGVFTVDVMPEQAADILRTQ